MVIALLTIAVALLAALAEWLHARRAARIIGLLAPSAAGRTVRVPGLPRWWWPAAALRTLAVTAAAWGLLTLLHIDGARATGSADQSSGPVQHLLIAMDVSPSMHLEDAGPEGNQSRSQRAAEALRSVLDRLDVRRVRVSIVAFYTTAKPVIVQSRDLAVITNVLTDLPLEHAFKPGQTNLYAGVREAAKLAKPWPPGSAALVVVSDGDTLPDSTLESLPPSIGDALVLGVGSTTRGQTIAGRTSRQDSASLRTLATRLRGQYFDGNARHLPSATLAGLSMLSREADRSIPLRTLALVAVAAGATVAAALWPLMAWFGPGRAARAVNRLPAPASTPTPAPAQALA